MKDQPVVKTWHGLAALLLLGCAAILILNQSGILVDAGKPDEMDVKTATRSGPATKGNDGRSHEVHRAADQPMMKPEDRFPVGEDRRDTAGDSVSVQADVSMLEGGLRHATEKPRPGKRDEAREDDDKAVAENTPAGPAAPPPGIQLAPDVRLPVAALPLDFQTNEVTAKMLDIIVADYYRDLAAGVTGEGNENGMARIDDNGETTIVVKNGPVAEAARQRADWRFRTIFGKNAFNRMSMQSNLEARLPVADAE